MGTCLKGTGRGQGGAQQTLAPPLASGMLCPAGTTGLQGGPVCSSSLTLRGAVITATTCLGAGEGQAQGSFHPSFSKAQHHHTCKAGTNKAPVIVHDKCKCVVPLPCSREKGPVGGRKEGL